MSDGSEGPAEHDRRLDRLAGPDVPGWVGRAPTVVAVVLAVATVVGMVALWPSGADLRVPGSLGIATEVFQATVATVESGPCSGTSPADDIDCTIVTFLLDEGPDRGTAFTQEFAEGKTSPTFEVGDRVVLSSVEDADPAFRYQYADRQRRGVLLAVAVVFAVAVVALGRMRGLAALLGLGASVVVLLAFVLPSMLEGNPPVAVAVVGASAIAYLALYLAHGFTRMTTVALLGTLGALALTAALSALVIYAARITGFTTEESFLLTFLPGDIDPRGLVLAGIVLGALGALDDVTVTQASAVWELRSASPETSASGIFSAGLRIGRDHIASTVNTLLLAYAGASMPLLVLFAVSDQSLGSIANSEIVATEIIRTLVGSIGLVAAVPVTTWLAAILAEPSDARAHGHHPAG